MSKKYDSGYDENDNPYRVQALLLIEQDKDIPDELLLKMLEYDREYS